MKYLVLVWEDLQEENEEHRLTFDFIKSDIFLSPCSVGEHVTAYATSDDNITPSTAKFRMHSLGNTVTFVYERAMDPENGDAYFGTMTLCFDSLTKANLLQAQWKPENREEISHAPGDLIVNAFWMDGNETIAEANIKGIIRNMGWSQSLYEEEQDDQEE